MPLLLGGGEEIRGCGQGDSSLGTGPKSKTVNAQMAKLSSKAGAVFAKRKTTLNTLLNIFEGELDGATDAVRTMNRLMSILDGWGFQPSVIPQIEGDNAAVADYIEGRGMALGARHLERRGMWLRETYHMNKYVYKLTRGTELCVDLLTKLNGVAEHEWKAAEMMGFGLLGISTFREMQSWLVTHGSASTEKESEEVM